MKSQESDRRAARQRSAPMQRYVAFLRGINLGKRRLAMGRLKALVEGFGFESVDTFIASGNVVFSSNMSDSGAIESRIAKGLEAALGYAVNTFVRTAAEVVRVGQANVFPEDGQTGITIHVGFLQRALASEESRRLEAIQTENDVFRVRGREYYWLCRVRSSDSRVWTLPELKAVRLPSSTMRNITTVRKLVAKLLTD